jgi:hypothetical protein
LVTKKIIGERNGNDVAVEKKKNECYKEFHNCLVYSIVFGDEMSVLFSIEMTTMACLK